MPRMHVVDRLASRNGGWRRGTFDVGSKESTLFQPKQLVSPSFLRFRRSTCITLCFSISKMVSSAIKM